MFLQHKFEGVGTSQVDEDNVALECRRSVTFPRHNRGSMKLPRCVVIPIDLVLYEQVVRHNKRLCIAPQWYLTSRLYVPIQDLVSHVMNHVAFNLHCVGRHIGIDASTAEVMSIDIMYPVVLKLRDGQCSPVSHNSQPQPRQSEGTVRQVATVDTHGARC